MSFTLTKPQRRKKVYCTRDAPFPVPISTHTQLPPGNSRWYYYTAFLIDGSILVQHSGDMDQLYRMGFFGKGTLSRHYPQYRKFTPTVNWVVDEHGHHRSLQVTSKRKYLQRAAWANPNLSGKEADLPLPKKIQQQLATNVATMSSLSTQCANDESACRNSIVSEINTCSTKNKEPDVKRVKLDSDVVLGKSDESQHSVCDQVWGGGQTVDDPWTSTTERESVEFWTTQDLATVAQSPDIKVIRGNTESNSKDVGGEEDTKTNSSNDQDRSSHLNESHCNSSSTEVSDDLKRSSSPDRGKEQPSHDQCVSGSQEPTPESHNVDNRCLTDETDGDLLVVADTDDSDVDASNVDTLLWHPVIKVNPFKVREFLQLSMEEAFFLSYALGCLVLYDEKKVPLDLVQMWNRFCDKDERFLARYVVYHNLRSKGWVPKSGLKYGSDFVVYKQGPAFYHSTYSVLVKHLSGEDLREKCDGMPRASSWTSLSAVNRITEQVSKDLMLCFVIEPSDLKPEEIKSPACVSRFKVQEVVVKRMMSKQEKENAEYVVFP